MEQEEKNSNDVEMNDVDKMKNWFSGTQLVRNPYYEEIGPKVTAAVKRDMEEHYAGSEPADNTFLAARRF